MSSYHRTAMRGKEIANLSVADQKKAAMEKIMRTVNICETSTLKMRSKLKAKGFCDEAIDEAINDASKSSAIDDMRYANCLVRSAISSKKGLAKVEHELKALGIDIHEVDAFIEFEESDEANQLDMAIDILRRHPPKTKNLYLSAYRRLLSKGYAHDIAAEASRVWCEERFSDEVLP